ncbi:hypothetical protein [Streptomyces sp. SPB162]|uniref:tetratricopeptide repeat protein n=1 Tax=Streptomyces sp. SPB162 TaxID=2940560 RepID=UPI0024058A3B|nr:hypothetical protein [Streptomyces sp. SPB162]MDF9817210.1 tetratricopeptide (TPR) repeat protein [Streptomyces sp. SPB162]
MSYAYRGNPDTTWKNAFTLVAPELLENSMREALANTRLGTSALVDRLPRDADIPRLASTDLYRRFVAHVLDSMIMQGESSSSFGEDKAFLGKAVRAVQAISDAAGGTTALWLAVATCHANLDNASDERQRAIHNAARFAAVNDDAVRSRNVLAHYLIDTSQYAKALRILANTEAQFAASAVAASHWAELLAARGMCYFYTDPDGADAWFQRAIAVGSGDAAADLRDDPLLAQAVSTALHYRGRVAASRGEYQSALLHFVEAQELAPGRLVGRGFHHVRLAEILLRHGPIHEAEYHLLEAERINHQARQFGVGAAQLQNAWAEFHIVKGDHQRAEHSLRKALQAAQSNNAPRNVLQFAWALGRLHLSRRQPFHAAPYMTLAVFVLLRRELLGNRHLLRNVRALLAHVPGALRRGRSGAGSTVVVPCPCGSTH